MKGSGYGILGDLVLGIIGAMIGGEIFGTFASESGPSLAPRWARFCWLR